GAPPGRPAAGHRLPADVLAEAVDAEGPAAGPHRARHRARDDRGGSPRRRLRGGTAARALAAPAAARPLRAGAAPPPEHRATMTPLGRRWAGWRRAAARLAALLCIVAGLTVAALATPVEAWRTGRAPATALPLVP